eukprot:886760-Alexandrium_andersonii.AAC.1
MADSPHAQGRPPPQRLTGATSKPAPNGRRTIREDALTQRRGAPRNLALRSPARVLSPIAWRPLGVGSEGAR